MWVEWNAQSGRRFQKLRRTNSFTQAELEFRSGVDRRTIRNWEHAKTHPNTEALQCVAQVLLGDTASWKQLHLACFCEDEGQRAKLELFYDYIGLFDEDELLILRADARAEMKEFAERRGLPEEVLRDQAESLRSRLPAIALPALVDVLRRDFIVMTENDPGRLHVEGTSPNSSTWSNTLAIIVTVATLGILLLFIAVDPLGSTSHTIAVDSLSSTSHTAPATTEASTAHTRTAQGERATDQDHNQLPSETADRSTMNIGLSPTADVAFSADLAGNELVASMGRAREDPACAAISKSLAEAPTAFSSVRSNNSKEGRLETTVKILGIPCHATVSPYEATTLNHALTCTSRVLGVANAAGVFDEAVDLLSACLTWQQRPGYAKTSRDGRILRDSEGRPASAKFPKGYSGFRDVYAMTTFRLSETRSGITGEFWVGMRILPERDLWLIIIELELYGFPAPVETSK